MSTCCLHRWNLGLIALALQPIGLVEAWDYGAYEYDPRGWPDVESRADSAHMSPRDTEKCKEFFHPRLENVPLVDAALDLIDC